MNIGQFCAKWICATTLRIFPRSPRGSGSPEAWSISEVGDGNLNLVFIVKGAQVASPSKQALPACGSSARAALPLSRSHYSIWRWCIRPGWRLVWARRQFCTTTDLALVVVDLLEPHIIMRKGARCRRVLSAFRRRHHHLSGAHAVPVFRPRGSRGTQKKELLPSPATMHSAR